MARFIKRGALRASRRSADDLDVASLSGESSSAPLVAVVRPDTDSVDPATGGLDPLGNTIGDPGDPGTIDGITLTEGMVVFLPRAAEDADEGLWVASAAPWTRPDNFADGTILYPGAAVVIVQGSTFEETVVYLMNDNDATLPIVVGTDPIGIMGHLDLQLFKRTPDLAAGQGRTLMNQHCAVGSGTHIVRAAPEDGTFVEQQAAHLDPATATTTQIVNALIAAGIMEAA